MKIKYSSLLMWMLILSPIADNLNGYLLLTGNNSNISVVFKTFLFLLCAWIALRYMKGRKLLYVTGISFVFILQSIYFAIEDPEGIGYNFTTLIKLLMPVFLILSFESLSAYDKAVPGRVRKISAFYIWFFPISLIIPMVFDFGFSTYGGGLGNKGLYFAGNEISIVMIMVVAISLQNFKKEKTKKNFVCLALGIAGALLIGTKAVYISAAVLILTAIYTGKATNRKLFNLISLVPVVFLAGGYIFTHLEWLRQIIDRWRWGYRYVGSNFLSFFLSGRGNFLARAWETVYQEDSFRNFMVGVGSNKMINEAEGLVEMDFFDLLFWFGAIVTLIIVFLFGSYLRRAARFGNAVYIVGICLVYAASVVSGHVLFAPMVTVVFAILYLNMEFEDVSAQRSAERDNKLDR